MSAQLEAHPLVIRAADVPDDTAVPWTDHLEELRYRLWWCLGAMVAGAALAMIWAKPLLAWLARPVGTLVFTQPYEAVVAHVKLALAVGVIAAAPVLAFHLWQFVSVALDLRERHLARRLIPWSAGLFLAGAAFGYAVVLPVLMRFFLSFSSSTLQPMIAVNSYLSFVLWVVLGAGAASELPVVMWGLTRVGIVQASSWHRWRPAAVLTIFVLAAIITPPDVVSQCLLALPLVALYEISAWLTRWNQRT